MKILFWTHGFWPRIGGIETQALEFIQSLTQRGHRCTVIAQQDNPEWPTEETYRGIAIRRFDFDSIISKKRLHELKKIESEMQKLLREFQPDLIHLNTWMGWPAFVFSLFRKIFPIPVVLTVHAPCTPDIDLSPQIDRICPIVDQICCVSRWVLTQMEQVPTAKGKLRLIYNGLSLPKLLPEPLCFSPPTLLLLGRLSAEKGFEFAIEALSQLKGSFAQMLIIGDGNRRADLQKLVSERNLDKLVRFIGSVPREEIPNWINRTTLLCMPSRFETFGLAALEAMQMQRPVIASRVGGLPEIVLDHETGLLVPEKDPQALAQAIQSLLAAPETAIQMGRAGHRRASERFTLEQNVTAYEDLYKTL